jgi:uncharacterized protein YjiK
MHLKLTWRHGLVMVFVLVVLAYFQTNVVNLGKALMLRGALVGVAWEQAEKKIGLDAYRVMIDARPIADVSSQASALTYSSQTKTLFTTIARPPHIVEISTEGVTLRKIPVAGLKDLEGIAHIEGDVFALADERSQQIYWVKLDATTRKLDVSDTAQLGLGVLQGYDNRGFEGLAWDAERQRLLVVNEKKPVRVIEISGLPAGCGMRDARMTNA